MKSKLLIVKERNDNLKLNTSIYTESARAVREIGESLEWLQYAEKTGSNYAFLPYRKKIWFVLHKIAANVQRKNPNFRFGYIVDEISHRVNTTVADEIYSAGLSISSELSPKDKIKLEKTLIFFKPNLILPRYPWFSFCKRYSNGHHKYKDLTENRHYKVKIVKKSNYSYFYVADNSS